MRVGLVAFLLAVALFMVVLTAGVITSMFGSGAGVRTLSCDAAIGPLPEGGGVGTVDARNLTDEQRGNAATMISIGKQRKLPPLGWQVAIQAGMTESGLRNLDYGDRDSLGFFQMRPSQGWGTVDQVTDPTYEINKFYDVLLEVPNWKEQRPGDSAQEVERSAFPDRYHRWELMAATLVHNIGAVADPTGCGESNGNLLPPATKQAAQAISFAHSQEGKPYVWGATGPGSYDCSGLTLRAYQAAGINLPRTSREQYNAGALLPVRQAQPGDLIFYAYDTSDPATIHHVAIYLGNNKIVEAQQTGVPVHTRDFNFDESELVGQAVRPGV
jgi:peptidoglycan DL-endopeptidase CwlO